MEGSVTQISFLKAEPSVVTMCRNGLVDTTMVFEKGQRHLCIYNAWFTTFELCISALQVENRLLSTGEIELDYLTEIHGVRTERCKMKVMVE